MTGPTPILHHHERSAGSVRIRKIFALKSLAWRSCPLETGESNPVSLILSDRMGGPILQVGASLWVDDLAITDALEALCPDPTLFPNGNRGMPLALAWWSNDLAAAEDEGQILAHADLIARQLTDGRDFLQGAEPGLADIHAFAGLHGSAPQYPGIVSAWLERMDALGEGERETISRKDALEDLNAGESPSPAEPGNPVRVTCLKSGASIEGTEISNGPGEIVVAISDNIRVHFPAIGYQLENG